MASTRVSFEPGARTAWHTHPLGQTLYVISGVGKMRYLSTRPPEPAFQMSLSPEALATLSGVSTATITTVLLKKGLRNIWMRGTKPLRPGQPRLVGPAFTLRFVPAREDLATPEVVVVADFDPHRD